MPYNISDNSNNNNNNNNKLINKLILKKELVIKIKKFRSEYKF